MRRRLANALLLAAAYYFGALIGFVLRIPPATPSVLWPPNAILTAALLLAPARSWPFYLFAVLPAHLLVQIPTHFPLSLALAFFFTNCSEALMAAGLVRWWSDDPTRFDTLRRIGAFLMGAVLIAPLASWCPRS
jgi:integral membrane sensor domain MASE1